MAAPILGCDEKEALMDPTAIGLLGMAVFAVVPLMFGVIIVVFVIVMATKSRPLPADPEASVTFHARALRPDQVLSPAAGWGRATYGRLTITPMDVLWESEDGTRWGTPISTVTVMGTRGAFSLTGSGVDVEIDGSGPWRFVVSDRTINKVMRNSAKDFREADAARKLTGLLLARGARQGALRD